MTHITIQSINYTDAQISIIFENSWFQEDILELRQHLLHKIPDLDIKEVITGADRENVRFRWLTAEFMLNFEYYSQSCWINAQDGMSKIQLKPLFNLLTKS